MRDSEPVLLVLSVFDAKLFLKKAKSYLRNVSYDLLIDEKWEGGIRHKTRWSEQDAEIAVAITVQAAAYLTRHRHDMKAVLSAQGVSALQYLRCAEQIVPFMEEGDIFGLGGAHRSLKFQAVFENNPLKHLIFEHLNYN